MAIFNSYVSLPKGMDVDFPQSCGNFIAFWPIPIYKYIHLNLQFYWTPEAGWLRRCVFPCWTTPIKDMVSARVQRPKVAQSPWLFCLLHPRCHRRELRRWRPDIKFLDPDMVGDCCCGEKRNMCLWPELSWDHVFSLFRSDFGGGLSSPLKYMYILYMLWLQVQPRLTNGFRMMSLSVRSISEARCAQLLLQTPLDFSRSRWRFRPGDISA
jgi:hypothetical protein